MTSRPAPKLTPDSSPSIRRKLKLICKACGTTHTYDVGRLYFWSAKDKTDPANTGYAFGNYFRCKDCDSPGPWEAADYLMLIALMMKASANAKKAGGGDEEDDSIVLGAPNLFDGTIIQCPAMGEQHLLRLIEREPTNAFLYTRLGNLLRGCGKVQAAKWYGKALALDVGDLEARFNLLLLAETSGDDAAMINHLRLLTRHLLAGRKTHLEELTRGIAHQVVERLMLAPQDMNGKLLRVSPADAAAPEIGFIRALWAANSYEGEVLQDFAGKLLRGESAPVAELHATLSSMTDAPDDREIDLVPSLRELVEAAHLDVKKLTVVADTSEGGRIRVENRHSVLIFDGKNTVVWEVGSLRELYRGDKTPPNLQEYPPEYVPCFFSIEKHVLTVCQAEGDRTDQEMEAVFSALRRRPDGKNHLGSLHDYLWQAAALTLGKFRLSQAEFEAITGQLERSVRKWALRPVSRNYTRYLRGHTPGGLE